MHRVALQPAEAVCCTARAVCSAQRSTAAPALASARPAPQLRSVSGRGASHIAPARALPRTASLPRPSQRSVATPRAMLDGVKRALGVGSAAPAAAAATFIDFAPSWEELQKILASERIRLNAPEPDLVNGPTHADSQLRLFGTKGEPRVVLYRDRAAWCPYCEKVWLQLEEKRIPYKVEWINMRCYGDKPPEFLRKVPSGLLPALELDGKLYTESAIIAQLLEAQFPDNTPLLPPQGTPDRAHADTLLRLERTLFGRWMNWLTSGYDDAGGRAGLEQALSEVEKQLAARGGAYFMGKELNLVDITFAPFLERIAASILYYKGQKVVGGGRWPNLDKWFAAMYGRPTFRAIASDYYTHAHDLPPQLGGCEFNREGPKFAAIIDGKDGASWRLPLPRLDAGSLEPYFPGDDPERDRLSAAYKMCLNRAAIARFAARAVGKPGTRRVSARLCDPSATPGEEFLPDVDAALRAVTHALLKGAENTTVRLAKGGESGVLYDAEPAAASLAYMRDRICVPRDLSYPAARQLRAHCNWVIDALGGEPGAK